jgi:peptide-methionine (S)-S-oxide reductase
MSRTLRLLLAASGLLIAAVVIAQVSAPGAGGSPAAASGARGTAILAGGCFWCVEADFEKLPGVISAESGYMRGKTEKPTYSQVSAGGTGHVEVVRIVFDPARVSYAQLLDHFWRNIDPTVKDQQFCDAGDMYRSGIYYLDADQRKAAEASRDALVASKRFAQVHTEIEPATTFWPAEAYHQDYYRKNPVRYKLYRSGCGRDARLAELWGRR